MLYLLRAWDAQSTASCCICSDMSAFLITAFRCSVMVDSTFETDQMDNKESWLLWQSSRELFKGFQSQQWAFLQVSLCGLIRWVLTPRGVATVIYFYRQKIFRGKILKFKLSSPYSMAGFMARVLSVALRRWVPAGQRASTIFYGREYNITPTSQHDNEICVEVRAT